MKIGEGGLLLRISGARSDRQRPGQRIIGHNAADVAALVEAIITPVSA
jgi:hypothetical protein